ncbi:MAG: type II toxin-antitoxin system VapC family toxin [Nitrospirae bacterium]|nr:type II toxin-antitoxin system VapC family toxin [Nitrospirota bacterium]
MILYCDTSALIKRYVDEEGSMAVDDLWRQAHVVAVSVVAFAESAATFSRKYREQVLTAQEYASCMNMLKSDYRSFVLIPITDTLNMRIEQLVSNYQLRGFDAIHLASALVLKESGGLPVHFACFDRALNEAAKNEGLQNIA